MMLGLKGMAQGLGILAKEAMPGMKTAATNFAAKHGTGMAVGAMGGYAASDDGFLSTAAGIAGGAGLGLAASRGAFGASVKAATRNLNSRGAMAANTAGAIASAGYSGAKMYCNKGINAIKSTMKG